MNGVLGILFWLLAGRLATAGDVALAITLSSLLILLSVVTQLNLGSSLSRFLGSAGKGQRSMIAFAYAMSSGCCAAVAAVLILLAALQHGELVQGANWGMVVLLVVGVPVWTAFALQDNVLIATRRAGWIPVENATAAVFRLALLPLVVGAGAAGIFGAYLLPAVPAVVVISWVMLSRLPKGNGQMSPERRGLLRFAASDFPGVLATAAALRLVPALILEFRGSDAAAFIGLPWTVLTVALLALPTLSLGLLADLSTSGVDTERVLGRARGFLLGLLPVCLLAAALVHPMLSIAGAEYAARGSLVLIGGVLAIVPAAATETKVALLRFSGRPGGASCLQLARAALLLGAAVALILTDRLSLLGFAVMLANGTAWALGLLLLRGHSAVSGQTLSRTATTGGDR